MVGLPSYDLPGKPDAGAIVVFSNVAAKAAADPRSPSARTLLTADDLDGLESQAGARFGAAVTAWHDSAGFDEADDCSDLLVGAPGQTVLGKTGAGQVYRLGGSESGLGSVKEVYDETMVGAGGPEPRDGFGSAIAANSSSTVAIGVPGRDVNGIEHAGRMIRLNWAAVDTDPELAVVEQDFDEDENAEAGDRFGEVLDLLATGDGDLLVVGIPHEDVGAKVDAGAVELFSTTGDAASMVTQNRAGAGGKAEAGDRYGASVAHWWTFVKRADGSSGDWRSGRGHRQHRRRRDRLVRHLDDAAHAGGPDAPAGRDGGDPAPELPQRPRRRRARRQIWRRRAGRGVRPGQRSRAPRRRCPRRGPWLRRGRRPAVADPVRDRRVPLDRPEQPLVDAELADVAGKSETGDLFAARLSSVQLTTPEDDTDLVWPVLLLTVPREDVHGVVDVGMAYLGYAPGKVSVPLNLPRQARAGIGMVAMQDFLF